MHTTSLSNGKKVLLTGATGFIGSHCLMPLLENGYAVHALFRKKIWKADLPVFWHKLDLIEQPHKIDELMQLVSPTHLLHFAWCTEHGAYWNSEENFRWVAAGIHLLNAFTKYGGTRAVFSGSCAEYGDQDDLCRESDNSLLPDTSYGKCKNAMRTLVEAHREITGLSTAWGRIFYPFGPHENAKRFVPYVITSLLDDRAANCSHSEQILDLIYVKDVANAFVRLLDSKLDGTLNIATGRAISLKEIAVHISSLLGKQKLLNFKSLPAPKTDTKKLVADTTRLSVELGWRPKYSTEAGLAETVHWWREQLHAATVSH